MNLSGAGAIDSRPGATACTFTVITRISLRYRIRRAPDCAAVTSIAAQTNAGALKTRKISRPNLVHVRWKIAIGDAGPGNDLAQHHS
jgi:hypothetical protein